jgi:hypothetical protein
VCALDHNHKTSCSYLSKRFLGMVVYGCADMEFDGSFHWSKQILFKFHNSKEVRHWIMILCFVPYFSTVVDLKVPSAKID